jgi:hypothetical protein
MRGVGLNFVKALKMLVIPNSAKARKREGAKWLISPFRAFMLSCLCTFAYFLKSVKCPTYCLLISSMSIIYQ